MDKQWKDKNKALNSILKSSCEAFIFCDKCEDGTAVGMKGNTPDLLIMMRNACTAIHGELVRKFGKECADALIKTILMTEDEMDEELENMKKKVQGIPKWLRRLMELEEKENDSTDEADSEEEEEEEDGDNPDSSDSSVHIHLHLHDSDDSGE